MSLEVVRHPRAVLQGLDGGQIIGDFALLLGHRQFTGAFVSPLASAGLMARRLPQFKRDGAAQEHMNGGAGSYQCPVKVDIGRAEILYSIVELNDFVRYIDKQYAKRGEQNNN